LAQVRCRDSGGVHRTPETGGRQGAFALLSASTFASLPSAPLGTGSANRRGRLGFDSAPLGFGPLVRREELGGNNDEGSS
jgi:hypothetical protein